MCPIIKKTYRIELRRINTTGETRRLSSRVLFDMFTDIKASSIFNAPTVAKLHG